MRWASRNHWTCIQHPFLNKKAHIIRLFFAVASACAKAVMNKNNFQRWGRPSKISWASQKYSIFSIKDYAIIQEGHCSFPGVNSHPHPIEGILKYVWIQWRWFFSFQKSLLIWAVWSSNEDLYSLYKLSSLFIFPKKDGKEAVQPLITERLK